MRGLLVRPLLYAAVEIDTSGVAVKSTGEWDDAGLERAGVQIVGDVATEYIKRTHEHFGGPGQDHRFSAAPWPTARKSAGASPRSGSTSRTSVTTTMRTSGA